MFSGYSGSEAVFDAEAEDWDSKVDDGGTGGNCEAIAQKGQDGSAPGSREGADMIFGQSSQVKRLGQEEGEIEILGKLFNSGCVLVKLSPNRSAIRNGK